jgi:predicted phage terminase large subunit-like protein
VSSPLRALSLALVDRELVRRRGLKEFVRVAWPKVVSAPLMWGWHMDAICEHLEALHRRQIRDLVVNIPPGFGKSTLCSVLFPAWVWSEDPAHAFITISYAARLALRDARKARTLVESEWWSARWPGTRIVDDRSAPAAAGEYTTTAGGMRYASTVRGGVTGYHGDTNIVDDPIDPRGASLVSGTELDDVLRWWGEDMSTRHKNLATGARLLIMQRLHERDLTSAFEAKGATMLCLPMRYERSHPRVYARDPRREEGELLCPARAPEDAVRALEVDLGPRQAAAQLQQRPAPAGGAVFREEWFRFWVDFPDGQQAQSWDMAFKETTGGSYVAAGLWVERGTDHYLVDEVFDRMDFARTLVAVEAFSARWPKALRKLVEARANGPAVVSMLREKLPGLELVEPFGGAGKVGRANAVQPLVAAGHVWLPHPTLARYPDGRVGAPWVKAFLHDVTTFPVGTSDDRVDQMTQYLNHRNAFASRFVSAMKAAAAAGSR